MQIRGKAQADFKTLAVGVWQGGWARAHSYHICHLLHSIIIGYESMALEARTGFRSDNITFNKRRPGLCRRDEKTDTGFPKSQDPRTSLPGSGNDRQSPPLLGPRGTSCTQTTKNPDRPFKHNSSDCKRWQIILKTKITKQKSSTT